MSDTPGPPRYRDREMEWIGTHSDVLKAYEGQWLVLEGEEIIAHGTDMVEVVAEARRRGVKVPFVFHVEPLEPGVARLGL